MFDLNATLNKMGFRLLDEIGHGGYARVFTVNWDHYPERTFVAKIINIPNDFKMKGVQSYRNEIACLSELYHRNIIKIYKHFCVGKNMVIIMEHCSNGTLYDYVLKNGPLDSNTFKIVSKDCLRALAYCHENKIAHRDIKPTNILLDENHLIKLCDFGLSDPTKSQLTDAHDGSLSFVPPEFLTADKYDPKCADIWSLGITFYFLITGTMPWRSTNNKDLKSEILIRNVDVPNCNPLIRSLISSMTRADPKARLTADQLLKHSLFVNLPPLRKIKKSDSIGTNQYSLATIMYKMNKGYTCRLPYNSNHFQTT